MAQRWRNGYDLVSINYTRSVIATPRIILGLVCVTLTHSWILMALVVFSTDEINPSINTKVAPMNGNETNLSNSYFLVV